MTIINHKMLEPLLIAIEKVTEAMADSAGDVKSKRLRLAIAKLEQTHDEYAKCCCRIAHVIKFPDIFKPKSAAPKRRAAAGKASRRRR